MFESTYTLPPWMDQGFDVFENLLRVAHWGGQQMVAQAMDAAPVRSGDTRRSISYQVDVSPAEETITITLDAGANAPQARWMELGTGVHSIDPQSSKQPIIIKAKTAKALAWPRSGKFVRLSGGLRTPIRRALQGGSMTPNQVFFFAKQVVQQGLKPRPFLKPALDHWAPLIAAAMKAAMQGGGPHL